jgi:hypothetical protein
LAPEALRPQPWGRLADGSALWLLGAGPRDPQQRLYREHPPVMRA